MYEDGERLIAAEYLVGNLQRTNVVHEGYG